jgi:hypothetical protein
MRKREDRVPVAISARMRAGAGWSDIVIRNVSPRGMLVRAGCPAPPGTYVEISRGRLIVAARTVWANGDMIGIRLQDPIQLDALCGGLARPSAGNDDAAPVVQARRIAKLADRSREHARVFQYLLLLIGTAIAAAALAFAVAGTLRSPFDTVRTSLSE